MTAADAPLSRAEAQALTDEICRTADRMAELLVAAAFLRMRLPLMPRSKRLTRTSKA